MQYNIFGDNMPAVTVYLERGESIYTQSGGMAWMSDGIVMETNVKGGMLKGLGRMFTGESLFMATYTATQNDEEITFASTFTGKIIALEVSGNKEYICQKGAFLCAEPGVELSAVVVKGASAGMFGGEGFVLQRLKGDGMAFIELDGSVCEVQLSAGQKIKVDTGHVAVYEPSVSYTIETVKGFKNILFGGEGLFLTCLEGPGRVWLQTITMAGFAGSIIPFMPKPSNK